MASLNALRVAAIVDLKQHNMPVQIVNNGDVFCYTESDKLIGLLDHLVLTGNDGLAVGYQIYGDWSPYEVRFRITHNAVVSGIIRVTV